MYHTVCPLRGPGHDSPVGEWMYLTVLSMTRVMIAHCPLSVPNHGSSVVKWMYFTVCPLSGQGHDSSVEKWINLTVCFPLWPGSIPGPGRLFQGIFPWLITLCQPVLSQRGRKWLDLDPLNSTTQPVDTKENRGPWTGDGWKKTWQFGLLRQRMQRNA